MQVLLETNSQQNVHSQTQDPIRHKAQNKARERAIALLARREHSRYELEQKLCVLADQTDIPALLDDLQTLGLQSDYRYVDVLIRSKANAGYGLKRIAQWASINGVASALFSASVEEQNIDWFAVALKQKRKHFGWLLAQDALSRAKQIKYLYNRGFSQDQISFAIDCEHHID